MSEQPRVLIVGCGGIGGTVAAGLVQQQLDVTLVTRNGAVRDAINAHGLRTRGEMSLGTVRARAYGKPPKGKRYDYVLLATQPPQVEEAARGAIEHVTEDGIMVVFQNGLCEPRIAAMVGASRVIGAIIAWGATMTEPGVFDRTSSGGFTMGPMEGSPDDERVRRFATMLEAIGPVTTTDNLMGARWSKLAINCAISSLGTVAGDRLGSLMRKRWVRRLALEVMSEVAEVAAAEGVRLEKVSGTLDLDWLKLSPTERRARVGSGGLLAKHSLLIAVGTRYRRLRSSMLAAIERGREPAVDFLNGEVVARADSHDLLVPVNAALAEAVREVARGSKRPSHATLEALYRRTRDAASLPPTAPAEDADTRAASEEGGAVFAAVPAVEPAADEADASTIGGGGDAPSEPDPAAKETKRTAAEPGLTEPADTTRTEPAEAKQREPSEREPGDPEAGGEDDPPRAQPR